MVSRATLNAQSWLSRWMRRIAQSFLKHLLLITVGFVFLFPFAWLVLTSLKSAREIVIFPPTIFPNQVQWNNYTRAVTFIPFFSVYSVMGGKVYLNFIGSSNSQKSAFRHYPAH